MYLEGVIIGVSVRLLVGAFVDVIVVDGVVVVVVVEDLLDFVLVEEDVGLAVDGVVVEVEMASLQRYFLHF